MVFTHTICQYGQILVDCILPNKSPSPFIYPVIPVIELFLCQFVTFTYVVYFFIFQHIIYIVIFLLYILYILSSYGIIWTAINNDFCFTLQSHALIILCVNSLICLLKCQYSCFSPHLQFIFSTLCEFFMPVLTVVVVGFFIFLFFYFFY